MWEKNNNNDNNGNFSITDLGDDELLRTLMEKDISKNNDSYKNWIISFNWRIANPYQPKQYIF